MGGRDVQWKIWNMWKACYNSNLHSLVHALGINRFISDMQHRPLHVILQWRKLLTNWQVLWLKMEGNLRILLAKKILEIHLLSKFVALKLMCWFLCLLVSEFSHTRRFCAWTFFTFVDVIIWLVMHIAEQIMFYFFAFQSPPFPWSRKKVVCNMLLYPLQVSIWQDLPWL